MRPVQEPRESATPQDARWLARTALAAIWLSVALMVLVGLAGPSAAVSAVPGTSGWPPYSGHLALPDVLVTLLTWAMVLIGGAGLAAGLVAVRRGWRPRPRNLIIGSIVAVVALTVDALASSPLTFDTLGGADCSRIRSAAYRYTTAA